MAGVPQCQPVQRPSRARLLIVIPLLLLVAIVMNWKDIIAVAEGKQSLWGTVSGKGPKHSGPTWSFPPPAGPEGAKVKVDVIAIEGSCCQRPLIALWLGISDLEPERIRVEFVASSDMGRIAPRGKHHPLEIGVECGVVINGQNGFVVGSGQEKRTLHLNGPCPARNLTAGKTNVPRGDGWTSDNLATVLNRLLSENHGQPGRLTGAAIEAAGRAADARIPPAKPVAVGRAR